MYRVSNRVWDFFRWPQRFSWPQRFIGRFYKTSSPTVSTQSYLGECEALRGVAILVVVIFHCYLERAAENPVTPNLLNVLLLSGSTAVTLFFVLSGFLLNLPFMAGKPIRLKDFFTKRLLRIMPVYGLMVIIAGIVRQDPVATIKSLLFWDIRLGTLWPFGAVWWSLVLEMQFYLVLPWLHMLWRAPRLRWLLLPVLATACLCYYHISRDLHVDYGIIGQPRDSILAQWPTFLSGALLALFHVRYGARVKAWCHASRLLRRGGGDAIFLGLLLVMELVLMKSARMGALHAYVEFFDHIAIEAALWAVIIGAILYLPSRTKVILVNPVTTFFGHISYSYYLLHYPVIFYGGRFLAEHGHFGFNPTHMQVVTVMALLGVPVATAMYRLVEKPMLEFKGRYAARGEQRAAPAAR